MDGRRRDRAVAPIAAGSGHLEWPVEQPGQLERWPIVPTRPVPVACSKPIEPLMLATTVARHDETGCWTAYGRLPGDVLMRDADQGRWPLGWLDPNYFSLDGTE